VAEQIHDYNVHIDANDVFWMIRVGDDAVDVDFDLGRASLRVSRLGVFDDHDIANSLTDGLGLPGGLGFSYPQIPSVAPTRAIVSFDIEWSGIVSAAQISNAAQRFKGSFFETEPLSRGPRNSLVSPSNRKRVTPHGIRSRCCAGAKRCFLRLA